MPLLFGNTASSGASILIDYLVVAGGGAGGYDAAGGGGAGGLVIGSLRFSSGLITVGNGGPYSTQGGPGTDGQNSILTGESVTVNAIGGGGGQQGFGTEATMLLLGVLQTSHLQLEE
jgi:hypothetical protein